MSFAFLVFDLIGRNAGRKPEGNAQGLARGCIHPELHDSKEAVGLYV
jgi:hypothetical protein